MVQHRRQQILVKLESVWKLLGDLLKHNERHTIQPNKYMEKVLNITCQTQSIHWRKTGLRSGSLCLSSPWPTRCENLWPKLSHSFSINTCTMVCTTEDRRRLQHLKAGEGAVVTVQQQHGQTGQLGGPVPAVTAVHHHAGPVHGDLVRHPHRARQDLLDVVQPVSGLEVAQPPLVINHRETHVLHLKF